MHRRADFALAGAGGDLVERRQLGNYQRALDRLAHRQRTAKLGATLFQVLDFRRIIGRLVERRLGDLVVRDGNAETVAECAQRVLTHFLLLMRDVLSFASLTHAIALDGLGKDHSRPTLIERRAAFRESVWKYV